MAAGERHHASAGSRRIVRPPTFCYEGKVRWLLAVLGIVVIGACADRAGGDVPPPRPVDGGPTDASPDRDAFVPPPDATLCEDEGQC